MHNLTNSHDFKFVFWSSRIQNKQPLFTVYPLYSLYIHYKRGCMGYNPPRSSQTEATNIKLVRETNFILAGPTDTLGQRGNALVGLANIKSVRETNLLSAASDQPYCVGL
jgi:hypothetical protein